MSGYRYAPLLLSQMPVTVYLIHYTLMELCCSFKSIVGGNCGFDSRDQSREVQVVPLTSCAKDIANHLAAFSFSGPQTEVELILCRAGIFQTPDSAVSMTICPLHRGKLGIGWTLLCYQTTEKMLSRIGQRATGASVKKLASHSSRDWCVSSGRDW